MRLLCRLGLHDWTNWQLYDAYITRVLSGHLVEGVAKKQRRTCRRCGIEQRRHLD